MAQKIWDNEITKNQDWGGDATTNNLPVSGNRVQEFIKNALENKMGTIYYDTTNNRYLIFSDVANKNEYLEDTTKVDLILGTFDAPFNYTASISLLSSINNVIFSGDKGNIIEFTFDIVDKSGNSTLESVNVTYSFISNGVKKSVTEQYDYGQTVRFNIDSHLGNGETIIQIAMVGLTTLAAITRSASYRVLDLSVDSRYDISQVNELSVLQFVQIPFYTKSSRHLFLRASVDYGAWELVMETDAYETNGTYSLNVELLGAGVHNIRFQAYNIIDGVTYYSNYVYRDILLNQNNQLNANQIMIAGNIPANVDDSTLKIKATHTPAGGIGAVSFAERNITIKKIVYPSSGTLNGSETIEQQENYSLNLSPIGFDGGYTIAWSITGNGASSVELLNTNNSSCTIKVNTFANDVTFNIVATVTPTGKTPFTVLKTVTILSDNIAISAIVNPNAMSKLYAAGLCSNSQYMYKSEAAAVTDIGTILKGMTDSNGSFLKWFTGLTSLGNECFSGCSSLTSMEIPSGITNIGNYCFYGCSKLTSIPLPSGITSIRDNCFSGCLNLHTMTIYAPTPPAVLSNTFGDSSSSYTGYTSKPNTLYVLANATGYESWSADFLDTNKCGFVLQKTL